jgi:hypothetical protein
MDWNLLFNLSLWPVLVWACLAYLVIVLTLRLTGSKSGQSPQTDKSSKFTLIDHLLGRSWIGPSVVLVLLLAGLYMTFERQFTGPNWSDQEAVEVDHFIESVSLYGEASTLSQKRAIGREDWESVNALMQASMAEAEQVSDDMLKQIDPELPTMWKDKFIPGLRIGSYGLRYYTALPQKGRDTVVHNREDSLKLSRTLLEEWNGWFTAHKAELIGRLE